MLLAFSAGHLRRLSNLRLVAFIHVIVANNIFMVFRKLCSLELTGTGLEVDKGVEPLTYCLQSVLAIQVLLHPSCDTQVLVNQLLMIQRIKV